MAEIDFSLEPYRAIILNARKAHAALMAPKDAIHLTAELVSAFVSRNALDAGNLPALIQDIHQALQGTQPFEHPHASVHGDQRKRRSRRPIWPSRRNSRSDRAWRTRGRL
jgi:hypothetical protein